MATTRRVTVLFSGTGKDAWFSAIALGRVSDTVTHAFIRTAPKGVRTGYVNAGFEPGGESFLRKVFGMLGSGVVVSSDVSPVVCFLGALHWASFGLLGPQWILVAINTSTTLRVNAGGPLRSLLRIAFLRTCTRIVCLARFQMGDLQNVDIPKRRLTFIPLGIDVDFFNRADIGAGEEVILSVGRDRGRDYEYLLSIAPHVPHPIRIIASEKNIPQNSVLPDNVSVVYDIPEKEMRDQLVRARIVVVPTKTTLDVGSDCSGQSVVLQALAAERPVVASVRPWIGDYLTEDKEFCALPDGDPRRAAKVLNDLWDDEVRRKSLGLSGRVVVQGKYTTKIFAGALWELICGGTA